MKITTSKQHVTNEEGTVIRTMYYLHIKTEGKKEMPEVTLNVGEKTHVKVLELMKSEAPEITKETQKK